MDNGVKRLVEASLDVMSEEELTEKFWDDMMNGLAQIGNRFAAHTGTQTMRSKGESRFQIRDLANTLYQQWVKYSHGSDTPATYENLHRFMQIQGIPQRVIAKFFETQGIGQAAGQAGGQGGQAGAGQSAVDPNQLVLPLGGKASGQQAGAQPAAGGGGAQPAAGGSAKGAAQQPIIRHPPNSVKQMVDQLHKKDPQHTAKLADYIRAQMKGAA